MAPVGETKKERLQLLKIQQEQERLQALERSNAPAHPQSLNESVPNSSSSSAVANVESASIIVSNATPNSPQRPSYVEIETQIADKMVTRIIIPLIDDLRNSMPQSRELISMSSQISNSENHEDVDHPLSQTLEMKRRSLLLMDGEKFQLQATVNHATNFIEENIGVVKFPSARSMDFQPNDKMRSFGMLKAYLKSKKFHSQETSVVTDEDLRIFDAKLSSIGMDKASRATYLEYFKQLPCLISSAYSIGVVQAGWKGTGLCPLNLNVIFRQNPCFEKLTIDQKTQIVRASLRLSEDIAATGKISDKKLHDTIHPIVEGTEAAERIKDTRNFDTCPLNYQRTVLITHDQILAGFRDSQAAFRSTQQAEAQSEPNSNEHGESSTSPDPTAVPAVPPGRTRIHYFKCSKCGVKLDKAVEDRYRCKWDKPRCTHRYCDKEACVAAYRDHMDSDGFDHGSRKRPREDD